MNNLRKSALTSSILTILLIALALTLLISCSRSDESNETNIQSDTGNETNEETKNEKPKDELNFIVDGKTEYKIVCPKSCGDELKNSINHLNEKISELLNGQKMSVIYVGDDNKSENDSKYEILIGDIDCKETKDILSNLKYNDYSVNIVGDKLVLAGKSESSTIKAIEYFIENIFNKSNGNNLKMSKEQTYTFRAKYLAEKVEINNSELSTYSIVFPNGNELLKAKAIDLRNIIIEKFGVCLSVFSDLDNITSKNEILLGKTQRTQNGGPAENLLKEATYGEDEGIIASNEQYILITGGKKGGFEKAYSEFVTKLIPAEPVKGVHKINLDAMEKAIADLEKVKIMSFNIWTDEWGSYTYKGEQIRRRDQVIEIINTYKPDVIGFQEAVPVSVRYLTNKLKDYDVVNEPRDNISYESNPIFYNKQKYTLIESGTKWISNTPDEMSAIEESAYYRIYTYVVLENKETKNRFVHVNTHLDYNHPANELQANILLQLTEDLRNMPIFYTADWNMGKNDETYQILSNAGLIDASVATEDAMDGPTLIWGKEMIDFCFSSRDNTIVKKHRIINGDKYSKTASDHYAIFVELALVNSPS